MRVMQYITEGERIFYRGETLTVKVQLDTPRSGRMILRTNLNMATARRKELIAAVEDNIPVLGRDWQDLIMRHQQDGSYTLTIPLLEVGCFDLKAFFQPDDRGEICWAEGDNLIVKVEPADTVTGNIIYTAFVRQFGPHCASTEMDNAEVKAAALLDDKNYTVIPPAGTFRSLIDKLDLIFDRMGCRILQLLPIHPTPTTFARMGRYGSPFAVLDYFAVNPHLAEFDRKATPLDQFKELVDAVHQKGGKIFLDIPVNHTGWASKLQLEHPDWFVRNEQGELTSPGAWGIVWEDLCKLDYRKKEVWQYMAQVFLFWTGHGVDGFRCDAGYMLPAESWNYMVAKVRNEYPDTIFLLEGLGGPMEQQRRLLQESDLDWAYSEIFQEMNREALERGFHLARSFDRNAGILLNYAETHDNARLAVGGKTFSSMRCALAALFSVGGGFGFANGVEWFATEKIDVHGSPSLAWGNPDNQIDLLRKLNLLLREHEAFAGSAELKLIHLSHTSALALKRTAKNGNQLLVLVNTDAEHSAMVQWEPAEFSGTGYDLLSGEKISCNSGKVQMAPGAFYCLTDRQEDLVQFQENLQKSFTLPSLSQQQQLSAAALDLYCRFCSTSDLSGELPEKLAREFYNNHRQLLERLSGSDIPPVTEWHCFRDENRLVPVPAGDLMLFCSPAPFRLEMRCEGKVIGSGVSLSTASGEEVLYLDLPQHPQMEGRKAELAITIFSCDGQKHHHHEGELLLLPRNERTMFRMHCHARQLRTEPYHALAENHLGGISRCAAQWGQLHSKYDCLLSGNLNADYPCDRRTMFTRCRIWAVVNGYSHELSPECVVDFVTGNGNKSCWDFQIPAGQGRSIQLRLIRLMAENTDAIQLILRRIPSVSADGNNTDLDGTVPVEIIWRPQLEDRINHELTKAFTGPERHFPQSIHARNDGFVFAPARDRELHLEMNHANSFHRNDQWEYMTHLPFEEYYGQECHTDLYSPGYFSCSLLPEQECILTAKITTPENCRIADVWPNDIPLPRALSPESVALSAMKRFIVKRDEYFTVIAGYPWFLDWGRDTLIALRGIIQAGFETEARAILLQFAKFERNGTIPNMIRGNDDSNRQTSDAPLYLVVASAEYLKHFDPEQKLLDCDCGNKRSLREVLLSIVHNYIAGAENGIKMDPDSGLIWSPAHYTWMDTNYPAGTPREGYPIEIQALWFAALDFLSGSEPQLRTLAQKVQQSVEKYFYLPEQDRFADCLHQVGGGPAATAVADDAIRPNQLLALNLNLITKRKHQLCILRSAEELLLPGAIRSLSTRAVHPPLPVCWHGHLLNNPEHPYQGYYRGAEDTSRKVAYHNGTGWTWSFPAYPEALYKLGGEAVRERALSLLLSSKIFFESGIPGQLPEVVDGDRPHRPGGCDAQAWGVTEFFRVWKLLEK